MLEARRGSCRPRRAAQHGADAGHHLARVEGLGDVVVGAQLQADDAVGVIDPRGEHDDRDGGGGGVGAQGAGDVEAVAVGQHQVEHEQVGALAAQGAHGAGPVVGADDPEAGLLQVGPHQARDLAVVVHHQNGLRHRRCSL